MKIKFFITICIFISSMQFTQAQETKRWSRFDLSGTWRLNTGETIVITQSGNTVTASFSPSQPCYENVRTTLFISPLEYEVIERDTVVMLKSEQFWACSGNEKLCKDCDIPTVYVTKFDAGISPDGAMIDGRRIAHYIRYEEKDGKYTNCRRDPSKDEWRDFSLTRAERNCDDLQRAYDQRRSMLDTRNAELDAIEKQYNEMYDRLKVMQGKMLELMEKADKEWDKYALEKLREGNFNVLTSILPRPPPIISVPMTAVQSVSEFYQTYQAFKGGIESTRALAQTQPLVLVEGLLELLNYMDRVGEITGQMSELKNRYDDKKENREPLERAMNDARKELEACLGKQ